MKKISEITIIPTIKMVLLFQIIYFNKKQLNVKIQKYKPFQYTS